MITAKTLVVIGETITRNSVSVNTLGEKMEVALKGILQNVKGEVDIIQSVDFGANKALLTILISDEKKGGK